MAFSKGKVPRTHQSHALRRNCCMGQICTDKVVYRKLYICEGVKEPSKRPSPIKDDVSAKGGSAYKVLYGKCTLRPVALNPFV